MNYWKNNLRPAEGKQDLRATGLMGKLEFKVSSFQTLPKGVTLMQVYCTVALRFNCFVFF